MRIIRMSKSNTLWHLLQWIVTSCTTPFSVDIKITPGVEDRTIFTIDLAVCSIDLTVSPLELTNCLFKLALQPIYLWLVCQTCTRRTTWTRHTIHRINEDLYSFPSSRITNILVHLWGGNCVLQWKAMLVCKFSGGKQSLRSFPTWLDARPI